MFCLVLAILFVDFLRFLVWFELECFLGEDPFEFFVRNFECQVAEHVGLPAEEFIPFLGVLDCARVPTYEEPATVIVFLDFLPHQR